MQFLKPEYNSVCNCSISVDIDFGQNPSIPSESSWRALKPLGSGTSAQSAWVLVKSRAKDYWNIYIFKCYEIFIVEHSFQPFSMDINFQKNPSTPYENRWNVLSAAGRFLGIHAWVLVKSRAKDYWNICSFLMLNMLEIQKVGHSFQPFSVELSRKSKRTIRK